MKFEKIWNLIIGELNNTFKNRWIILYSLSYFLVGEGLTQFSLLGVSNLGLEAVGRITAALINVILYLTSILSLILGGLSIIGEKESGILEWLYSEPISKSEIIISKFIGLLISISTATILGFGLTGWFLALYFPPNDMIKYTMLIPATIIFSATCIAIGMLISVISKNKLEAFGLVFVLWLVMIFIYDLVLMGLTISLDLNEQMVFVLTILNPFETSRILMMYIIDPTLTFLGSTGTYTTRDLGSMLPFVLVITLILYVIIALLSAIFIFIKRDII